MTKFGEIVINMQNGFACGERDNGGIIQIRMNNLDTLGNMVMNEYIRVPKKYYSDAYNLLVGDVLFNHTNSAELVGKTLCYNGYSEPVTFSNHFVRIRLDANKALPQYISSYFNMLWCNKYFENFCDRWIGQAAFQPKKIAEVEIPLPSIDEQHCVAAEIERQLVVVEKAKQAAIEQLVTARKLNAAYLRDVFLQNGGEQTRLGDICVFEGGSQPPKSTFKYSRQDGYIRLIQIQDYRRDDMAVYIPFEFARRFCKKDDVMIGRYGPPVFQILRGLEGAYNVALMKAYPRDISRLDNGFLYYLLQEESIQNAVVNQSQRSAGQTGVDKDFLENRIIVLPDITAQRYIVSQIESKQATTAKIVATIQAQLDIITAMPAAILRQAFNGYI